MKGGVDVGDGDDRIAGSGSESLVLADHATGGFGQRKYQTAIASRMR